ncbi:MAG: hypothetical protein NC191_05270 [Muribaculaceae bacterium]|nr:hypothetical protein [Muribaculaceae bacterium]
MLFYLNKNGKMYSGVDALGDEYNSRKETIRTKVKSQFGKDDVPGVVFHENSSIASAINKSQELQDFINKNATDLKAGKEVTGSIGFNSNSNLHNALGKVDVLSAKINDGYVEVIILDTYDFNKDDPNWKVQMAYRAQKAGKLNPYYTIIKCRYKL